MTNHTQNLLEAIKPMPGCTVNDLLQLVPDCPPKSAHSFIRHLVKTGRIEVAGVKRLATGQNSRTYRVADPATRPAPKPIPIKQDVLAELRAEIAALKQFQTEALARYPDLAVPVEVLAARKLVAELIEDKIQAEAVLAGRKDSTLPMRAALAAWERGAPV